MKQQFGELDFLRWDDGGVGQVDDHRRVGESLIDSPAAKFRRSQLFGPTGSSPWRITRVGRRLMLATALASSVVLPSVAPYVSASPNSVGEPVDKPGEGASRADGTPELSHSGESQQSNQTTSAEPPSLLAPAYQDQQRRRANQSTAPPTSSAAVNGYRAAVSKYRAAVTPTTLPTNNQRNYSQDILDVVRSADRPAPNVAEVEQSTQTYGVEYDSSKDEKGKDQGRKKPEPRGSKPKKSPRKGSFESSINKSTQETVVTTADQQGNLSISTETVVTQSRTYGGAIGRFGGKKNVADSIDLNSTSISLPPQAQSDITDAKSLPNRADLNTLAVPGTSVTQSDMSGNGWGFTAQFWGELDAMEFELEGTAETVARTDADTVTVTDIDRTTKQLDANLGAGLLGADGNFFERKQLNEDRGVEVSYEVMADNSNSSEVQKLENHLAGNRQATPERSVHFDETNYSITVGLQGSVTGPADRPDRKDLPAKNDRTLSDAIETVTRSDIDRNETLYEGELPVEFRDTTTFSRTPVDMTGAIGFTEGGELPASFSIEESSSFGEEPVETVTMSKGNISVVVDGAEFRDRINDHLANGDDVGPLALASTEASSIAWGAMRTDQPYARPDGPPTHSQIGEVVDLFSGTPADGTYDEIPSPAYEPSDHAGSTDAPETTTDDHVPNDVGRDTFANGDETFSDSNDVGSDTGSYTDSDAFGTADDGYGDYEDVGSYDDYTNDDYGTEAFGGDNSATSDDGYGTTDDFGGYDDLAVW